MSVDFIPADGAEVMTIADFIEQVKLGAFTNYDGSGYYSMNGETYSRDCPAIPSEIICGKGQGALYPRGVVQQMSCRADPLGPGPNYGNPHAWVPGKYDGKPRDSCVFCGIWRDEVVVNSVTRLIVAM
jgi:hypothetical protein